MTTISATFHPHPDDDIAHTINARLQHATLAIGPNATVIAHDPVVLHRLAKEAANAAAELEAMLTRSDVEVTVVDGIGVCRSKS